MPFTPVLTPDSLHLQEEIPAINPFLEDQLETYTSEVSGVKGIPHTTNLLNNSWISTILIICFLLFTCTYRYSSKFFTRIVSDAFQAKQRNRAYQKNNVGVARLKTAMLLQTFLLEGLTLYIVFQYFTPTQLSNTAVLGAVLLFAAGCFVFYFVQILLFGLLGYVFSAKGKGPRFLSAFSSITALRGLLLFLPVLIAIYHSYAINTFIIITISLYLLTRILFVYKGVKIFFSGFNSLIYLILYLCTFEIAPLFVVYKGLFLLFSFVELKLF